MLLKQHRSRFESLTQPLWDSLDLTPTEGEATVEIPVDLLVSLCEGHFTGDPLVPGAYQLGLGVGLVERSFGRVAGIRRSGFRAPLRPDGHAHIRAIRRPGQAISRVEISTHAGESISRFDVCHEPVRSESLECTTNDPMVSSRLDSTRVRASLRHRPPALLVDYQVSESPRGADFAAIAREGWHWSEALDGAAQAAGLWSRREYHEEGQSVYVAAFERIALEWKTTVTNPFFRVQFVRRVMNLSQFRFAIIDSGETRPWITGQVALASAPMDEEAQP